MVKVVVGLQWGDEGKGKLIDFLCEDIDIVARFQGGANAGHTVVWQGNEIAFHHIPSGIIHTQVTGILGPGMVVDIPVLLDEIRYLKELGISVDGRLKIDWRTQVVRADHKEEDAKDKLVGTTKRGIGPAYRDKYGRRGLRIVDIFYPQYAVHLPKGLIDHYTKYQDAMSPYVCDTVQLLHNAINEGKSILAEGAQGTFLDIGFGTYPYVTASYTIAGGTCIGLGISPKEITEVIGVFKAYTTRVGHGPLPTELEPELGSLLRERGKEYGATTRRPRRCGWLDLHWLKFAVKLNGVDKLAITKLDVLTGLHEIKVAVGYEKDLPFITDDAHPIYVSFKGWSTSIRGSKKYSELPLNARRYLKFIEDTLEIPIKWISTGPERDAIILR